MTYRPIQQHWAMTGISESRAPVHEYWAHGNLDAPEAVLTGGVAFIWGEPEGTPNKIIPKIVFVR